MTAQPAQTSRSAQTSRTALAVAVDAPAGERRTPGRPRRVLSSLLQGYSLVLLWLLMILLLIVVPGNVHVLDALRAVLGQQTPLIFLGLAVVITMAVGELDLSFAAIFGLSAVTLPALVVLHGWSYPLAALAALAVSLVFGAVNAALVVGVGINSVVVTLGVSSVAGGLALLISGETTVSGLDPALSVLALGRVLGLPLVFWYGIVLVAVVGYVMIATPLGRHMLFVGSNRSVARLAGVAVTRVRVGAFLASALLCGIAGLVISTGLGGFNPSSAASMLLQTFAAVFLGTVAVVPGRFNPVGMAIAAYFLLTGVFGMQLLGLTGWVTDVFFGGALVVAVTVSFLLRRRVQG